ncbi:hypothetical protein [Methylobacter sp. YRD-M1]|uniref:hypothetical protein n=1 Tax=Methylobacter sp. YRD-M1 TaxID=2911520 RepID=UPI00227C4F9D|nr:hypothetical protein [Methylobacter sp. YRD-M1]WAK01295.1 hypothetical protein LZ558_15875 [Methylobacter sp. YRD-M1]
MMVMNIMLAACFECAGRRLVPARARRSSALKPAGSRVQDQGIADGFVLRHWRIAHGILVLLLLAGKVAAEPATQDAVVSDPVKSNDAVAVPANPDISSAP